VARIRTIKPSFFRHADLYEAEKQFGLPLRLAFAGLWTAADREGRFKWRPRELKLDCLPHDEVDFSRVLDALTTRGFIVKYEIDGKGYGCIPSWSEHQVINNRETPSDIPAPNEINMMTREPRVDDASTTRLEHAQGEGKGREEEREIDSEAVASGAIAPLDPAIPEREYFLRSREVLGKGAGGLIAKLLKAKGGNVALARAAIEQASQKQNPTEYVAAICRGPPAVKPTTAHQQERQTGREILDDIGKFISSSDSQADSGLLRYDPGDGSEGIRSRLGGNLIDLSAAGSRSRG
jgi:hypothetical protein